VRIASAAAPIAQYAGPGGFNDLDMMVSRTTCSWESDVGRADALIDNWQR
jgi:hypothetical protein